MRQKYSDRRQVLAAGSRFCLAALLGLTALRPSRVLASDALDSYRAQGVIAERYDGYVELRSASAPADASRLVDEVNAKRRALYQKRAAEQNVPVSEVGKIFAAKIFETAPGGTYFRQPGGGYVRK